MDADPAPQITRKATAIVPVDSRRAHALENDGANGAAHARWNVKMLLRRGQGKMGCKDFDGALQDLHRALTLVGSKEQASSLASQVRNDVEKAKKAAADRKARERGAYAKALFGGDNALI